MHKPSTIFYLVLCNYKNRQKNEQTTFQAKLIKTQNKKDGSQKVSHQIILSISQGGPTMFKTAFNHHL